MDGTYEEYMDDFFKNQEVGPNTPPEVEELAQSAIEDLLPRKSRKLYEKAYSDFKAWCKNKKVNSVSEKVLIAYFNKLSKTNKPSSLWSTYSKIKSCLAIKENINIKTYTTLIALLKRKGEGYTPKKASVFTRKQIEEFIINAPDQDFLMIKVIEQDRHQLRRKLANTQAECETRLLELQADVRELQRRLGERENTARQTEKEKNALIVELTEQNQRLTAQIKEGSKMEEQLTLQLQSVREQAFKRKTSLQDHQSSLDVLRDEILLMTEKKNELERRLGGMAQQRDSLSSALDEATDRIMLLERQMREQQMQMRVSHSELEELRNANGSLGERLHAFGNVPSGQRSLHSEMECDDVNLPVGDEYHQMKVEIVSVYDRVRAVCQALRQRSQQSIENGVRPDITIHQVKVGLLTAVIQELCDLIAESQGDYSTSSVSVTDLEIELHRAQESLDRMAKEMEAKSEELKKRGETIMDLTSKLSVREAELDGVKEERDQAKNDLESCGSQEELVRQAWDVRDRAVARKNVTQVELAKSRIDVMQANSQLMEAIQQKVELSQQLEQWQMDVQALLDEQMKRKLANPEQPTSGQTTPSSAEKKRSTRRLFGLFQR